jgi:NCS2 family nucleobase:cation symporter-2
MAQKPKNIIYGVDENPPLSVTLLLGLQHIFVMSSTLLLPVVIVREIGGSFLEVRNVVSFSLIAAGIGTILQCLGKWRIGSGYLVPNLCGPSYLSVSIQAAWLGGLPLMYGMTVVAGLFETLFSRVVHKLRGLFPTEVTGLVVLMVGVALIPLGASKFVGIHYEGDPFDPRVLFVAAVTLTTMVGISLWSKGKSRLYSVLIGFLVGYVFSYLAGIISPVDFEEVRHAPVFALPGFAASSLQLSFSWSLLPAFLIVSLCGALKSFGNLVTAQKINDENWKEPDVKNIGNGLFADGLSVMSAGLLGGVATDTSSSNVGTSLATGATSRVIGFVAGALFICLGFMPKLAALVSIMPDPVMGAILIYVTSFMVLSGFQIILTEALDTSKTFIIGISFIFGISLDILPGLYVHLPVWLMPVFGSSLTLATVMAILLNQLFRIRKI